MMKRSNPIKRNSSNSSSRRQDDFGAEGSVGGVAGDSIGMNLSTTGDGSLRSLRPKPVTKSDLSFYEDDSVMLWSDDPEKQYFAYILQREQENRAKRGKSAEDSLIGDSTLEEIQQEFDKWHQHGGQEDSDQDQSFKYSLPPGSQRSNQAPSIERQNIPNRQHLDGFSLATTEKSSRKEIAKPETPDTKALSMDVSQVFPDVIYVADTPATSVSMSKRSKDSSSRGGKGRMCFIFSLLLMGSACLAAAGVGTYVYLNSKQVDENGGSTVTSVQDSAGENNSVVWTEANWSPTIAPTQERSSSTAPETTDPTSDELLSVTVEPTSSPETILTMEPTAIPVTVPATPPRTENPTSSPTVSIDTPTSKPTIFPTSEFTLPAATTLYCGCKNCEVAINRMAEGYSCQERINFLLQERGYSELEACRVVAGAEFPTICGMCNPDICAAPINTAEAPESSTTPRPSLRPTNSQQTLHTPEVVPLELRGNNGRPTSAFPLGECEGDCDNDDDCEPGLRCFQRTAGQSVPGCLGGDEDSSQIDFCVLG